MEVGQEHIDKYLRNEMGSDELKAFLAELDKNPNLAESVEVQRQIVEAIRAEGHASMKTWLASETSDIVVKPMYGRFWMAASVAACIILAAVAYYFMKPEDLNHKVVRNETPESKEQIQENQPDKPENNIPPPDPAPAPDPPPTIEIVEDVGVEDEEIYDVFEDDEPVSLGDDYIPPPQAEPPMADIKRDEKISTKELAVVLMYDDANPVERSEASSSEFKKINDKTTKTVTESETKEEVIQETENIQVELWSSSVNYRGYKFWGGKLILYGPLKEDKLTIIKISDVYYLQWKDDYYSLIKGRDFRYYTKLNEQKLPNSLKR